MASNVGGEDSNDRFSSAAAAAGRDEGDAARVAKEFTRLYYHILNENPEYLHQFYGHDSTVTVSETQDDGSNLTAVADSLELVRRLTLTMFAGVRVTLTNCTPQSSLAGSVQLMVTGVMKQKNCDEERLFTQALLLAKQDEGYYVLTDTVHVHSRNSSWKVLNFKKEEKEEEEPPAVTVTQSTPASTGAVAPTPPPPPPPQEPESKLEVIELVDNGDASPHRSGELQEEVKSTASLKESASTGEGSAPASAPAAVVAESPKKATVVSQARSFEDEPVEAPPSSHHVAPIEKPMSPVQQPQPPSQQAQQQRQVQSPPAAQPTRRSYKDALNTQRRQAAPVPSR